ncbi:hypothetical protein AB0A76_28810 [Streptomyces exfoliatus]|uniref:Uncharacterized protein n=1 Tax=Streptomyces exfoliatus TaxID=1905 RepID=A0ABV3D5Z6_STREX
MNPPRERPDIAPYQHLVPPGLQRVGADGMHCTLLHAIGLSRDDVDTDALVTDVASRDSTVRPFTLTFDRPAVGPLRSSSAAGPGARLYSSPELTLRAARRDGDGAQVVQRVAITGPDVAEAGPLSGPASVLPVLILQPSVITIV